MLRAHRTKIILLNGLFGLASFASFASNAQPSGTGHGGMEGCNDTAKVTNANDSGNGSLRAAINDLCPEGTITFANRFVIPLQSEIVIDKALTLDGSSQSLNASAGDASLVQILGGASHRIFRVDAAGQLSIKRLRLSNGTADGSSLDGFGGAIRNRGRLELRDCRIDGNSAINAAGLGGGAIFNDVGANLLMEGCTLTGNDAVRGSALFNNGGTAELMNSTFSDNRGGTNEGAIQNRGTLTAVHITVSNNGRLDGTPTAGGLFAFEASTTLINSILADNQGRDCFISGGTLDAVALLAESRRTCEAQLTADPALGELGANGGVTTTRAPAADSPAVDTADPEFCLHTDQRGFQRPRVSACDLGAIELEGRDVLIFSDGFETP